MESHQLLRTILLLSVITASSSISLRSHNSCDHTLSHRYWFSKDHPNIEGDDDHWFYCDLKCITLQKLNPNKDFVVVTFSAPLKQKFSACYVKVGTTYTLWSKVTSNQFYQKHCGEDYKDWIAQGNFNIDGYYGVGIGTLITEEDAKKMYVK